MWSSVEIARVFGNCLRKRSLLDLGFYTCVATLKNRE